MKSLADSPSKIEQLEGSLDGTKFSCHSSQTDAEMIECVELSSGGGSVALEQHDEAFSFPHSSRQSHYPLSPWTISSPITRQIIELRWTLDEDLERQLDARNVLIESESDSV